MKLLPFVVALGLGCSAGETSGISDGGTDVPNDADPGQSELLRPFADFEISIFGQQGAFAGFAWRTHIPSRVVETQRIGDCVFASAEPRFCDPGCETGSICMDDNVCMQMPDAMPIGAVTVSGTTPPMTVTANDFGYYTTDPVDDFLAEGQLATVSGTGNADVADFSVNATGVRKLVLPTSDLVATEHEDLTVRWDVGDNDDAEVVIHFDSDHHGLAAYLECTGPDSGELTIPAAIIDALIEVGETGIGTYIENSYIQRRSRGVLDRDDARIQLTVVSHEGLQVETVRAP